MMRRLLWMVPLALAACGYTDGGTGSHNLLVHAAAEFKAADGTTTLSVDLSLASTPVDDATVVMRDPQSGATFPLTLDAGTPGHYASTVVGYHRRLQLGLVPSITHTGPGYDLSARLEGPGPHVVLSPKPGTIVHAGGTLGVSWGTTDGLSADEVVLTVNGPVDLERTVSADTGSSHDIPLSLLTPGAYELRVARQNGVDLDGGVAGSRFTSSYEVPTNFTVAN
jgi:hypothetical protein